MKRKFFKWVVWWLVIFILTSTAIGYIVSVVKVPYQTSLAQGEDCPRSDLPPAPTPVISQQPSLSTVNEVLTNMGNGYNWPEWVLKTIAKQESDWRQIDSSQNTPFHCEANENDDACTCVSPSGDYGIMQLNWSVHNASMDWDRVQQDYAYNIEQGASILASSITFVDVNDGDLSNTSQPINQYLKFWGYNGYSNNNNPADPTYNRNRNWKDDESGKIDCPKDNTRYTYQEEIFYKAKCDPNVDGTVSWPTIGDFPLPDDALFASDLERDQGPNRDILIFDVQASSVCLTQVATFQYTLITTQSVTTQITIRDQKPWTTTNIIKSLPIGVNEWDGTNEAGQVVPEAEYWFTVAVTSTNSQLIGSQSGPVQVGCQQIYLPVVLKNHPLPQDTYEPNDSLSEAYSISDSITYTSYIWETNDVDWFRFSVSVPPSKERLVEANLKSIPAGTDYDLAIYDANGNELEASTNSSNADEHVSVVANSNETYYLKVYLYQGTSQSDRYELRVEIGPAVVPRK